MGEAMIKSSVLYKSMEAYRFTTLSSTFLHIWSSKYNLELSLINGDRFPRPTENTLYIEIPEGLSFRIDGIGTDFRTNKDGDTVFGVKVDKDMILSNDTNVYYSNPHGKIRKIALSQTFGRPERLFQDISEYIDRKSNSFQIPAGTEFRVCDSSLIAGELDSSVKINKTKLSMVKIGSN